jgi:hypothetical protein
VEKETLEYCGATRVGEGDAFSNLVLVVFDVARNTCIIRGFLLFCIPSIELKAFNIVKDSHT